MLAMNTVLGIYLAAALVPAVALLLYIYKKDAIEHEPAGLLFQCLLMGVCAAFLAIVLETIGETFLYTNGITEDTTTGVMILAFCVVAVAEEGAKLLFLKWKTWKNKNFDYKFDGVVYAVFVSLGFAAFENVKYVFSYGLSVALPRAALAIPGHMSFAVLMGIFYSRAKQCERAGDSAGKTMNLLLAFILPVLLHGAYDTCAMSSTGTATLVFGAIILAVYILCFVVTAKEAKHDQKI